MKRAPTVDECAGAVGSDGVDATANAASSDPHDLDRFLEAQRSTYAQALAELRAGQKRFHWSWYVLPQLRGLGHSPMSIRDAISDLAEAAAYLAHPLWGARLRETVAVLHAHTLRSAEQILGHVDAQKFRSCITLFGRASKTFPEFREALRKDFAGIEDASTIALLASDRKLQ